MAEEKEEEVQILTIIYQKLGFSIGEMLAMANIKPNQVTFLGFLVGIISAVYFSFGDFYSITVAAILLQFNVLIDCIDGTVARKKGLVSELGGWLDNSTGLIVDYLVIFASAFGYYSLTQSSYVWIFTTLAIGSRFAIKALYLQSSKLQAFTDNKYHPNQINQLKSLAKNKLLAQFIYSRFMPVTAVLTLGGLLNQVYYALAFLGAYGTAYYFASWLYLYYKINKHHKSIIPVRK